MNVEIRVTAIRKTKWCKNPLSGHEWPEYGPVTGWEVSGPFGHISKHRSEACANETAEEWREYFRRYPIS